MKDKPQKIKNTIASMCSEKMTITSELVVCVRNDRVLFWMQKFSILELWNSVQLEKHINKQECAAIQ